MIHGLNATVKRRKQMLYSGSTGDIDQYNQQKNNTILERGKDKVVEMEQLK